MFLPLAAFYLLLLVSKAVAETKEHPGISTCATGLTVALKQNETNIVEEVQGWTHQPDGRGSLDIIMGCCTTIFLCCWSVLCINVPSSHWGRRRRIHEKFLVCAMSGLGPEFTFQLALGQWVSACQSVQDFRSSGFTNWTLSHAFLADMGGFSLKAPDFVEFPLNAKQVHYLVTHSYIEYSAVALPKDIMDDKNKGDGVVRFFTICQLSWFSLGCLGRAIEHLAITTMELSALAFVFCTLGTYFFWFAKPMDVGSATVLVPNTSLREILLQAGDRAREPYKTTPLDFVGRTHSSWLLYWTYWMNIVRKMHLMFPVKRGPVEMIPDDNFPPLTPWAQVILFLCQLAYTGVHLMAWKFHFPTDAERLLWRLATIYMVSSVILYWTIELLVWRVYPLIKCYIKQLKKGGAASDDIERGKQGSSQTDLFARLRNNSSLHDPSMGVPLRALIPVTILGVVYCFARAYVFIASWIGIRRLPTSAYQTVDWTNILPHI
jgi:hypothetical protein